ncbi:DEAD/DEAH box helicase [Dietzia sp. UCD-THP]|uniref:DEAD/DEAH box helicase n=1 Tax=Dietzia sp. UCD-THP TaxID=1292020 RepID=UPI0003681619|nr:DEAD/DEAH box helicase [Dietzia sp. UCD-THP]EYT61804.1 DEAD/DEAH box helicase [Dietzia sp. UCD-THP]
MHLPDLLADLDDVPSDLLEEAVFDAFVAWADAQGLTLYPAQEEAVLEVTAGSHVVLATPTGSGKSLVALGAHFSAMARGTRSYYTAPIKALVSEKFFSLCAVFGAENVGMLTGDAAVNADAPIVCATAEIVANIALREGADADIGQVVMDEFHYYSEPDRGWAWQVPLIELPDTQFLLMSATLGDVDWLIEDLRTRTGRECTLVGGTERPVPLTFDYALQSVHESVELLLRDGKAPVYIVHFTQASALEQAQALTSVAVSSKERKAAIAEQIGGFRFTTSFGRNLRKLLLHGIGVHHAGMLPKYRRLVERLAQDGLLTVICGTDTLGVGINVPIRTVLFTGLTKFDGRRQRVLKAREFHQIAGRAGRAGFDTEGLVVVLAPEHEVENAKAAAKTAANPKKKSKAAKKKPPEGFVNWTRATFDKLVGAQPEQLTSRFEVNNAMLLNVISRPGSCYTHMRHLLLSSHETRARVRHHVLRSIELFRGLETAGIVERMTEPDDEGRHVRLTMDLQRDFALNQPLAPFAIAAMEVLDPDSPTPVLDLVSVIESVLDDPRPILYAQQRAARGEAIGALKAEGVEYSERMELVEDITWPTPLADLLADAYDAYRAGHPWVAGIEPSPKSVIREMVERGMTFSDLVSAYGLSRSEGSVLRYLTDAYRALRQTVPAELRTEEFDDLVEWLGELVRQVDSSLLDEWELLTDPEVSPDQVAELAFGQSTGTTRPVTANLRAFRVMVRNAMFRRVELLARDDIDTLARLDADVPVHPDWDTEIDAYWDEYDAIGTGPAARGPALFSVAESGDGVEPGTWRVRQVLDDPEHDHGWAVEAVVDLGASDEAGEVRFASLTLAG